MSELVFFLEEPSAEEMLKGFLPKLLPAGVFTRYVVFEGKSDFDAQLERRIRGYRVPNARFVILRDKDAGNCKKLKKGLAKICAKAGKPGALVRIAIYELESWYLADLAAVEKGLEVKGLAKLQNKKLYARPDNFPSPAETLKKIAPQYQKVGGSRVIGPHLNPKNRRSHSFGVFVDGVKRLCR